MNKKRVLPLRIYEILPDIIDLMDDYFKGLSNVETTYEEKLNELHEFLFHLEKYVDDNFFININPKQLFNSMKQDAKKDRKYLDSFNLTQKIRQLFYSNQEIRNANLIANFAINSFAPKQVDEFQEKVDSLINGQTVSQAPPLNLIVDNHMMPIYSSYLHLYEAKYFPSSHKSINSHYISSLLQILFKSNASNSITAYESQLENTTQMLFDLIESSTQSRTEYELVQLKRKYPSSEIILNSPIYKRQKVQFEKVFRLFTQRLNEYDQSMKILKNTFQPQLIKMRENSDRMKLKEKELSELIQQDEEISSRLFFMDHLHRELKPIGQWQEHIDRNARLGPFDYQLKSICEPFDQWNRLQEQLHACLTKDIPQIRDLDKFIKELPEFKARFEKNKSLLAERLMMKDSELKEIRKRADEKTAHVSSKKVNALTESQMSLEGAHYELFKENQIRLNHLDESKDEFERLLCSLSKFVDSKPISQLLENAIISPGSPKEEEEAYNSEIQMRINEVDEIEKMVDERTRILDNSQKVIKNINEDSSLMSSSSKENVVYIERIDQKYTEDRMFLSCMYCDSESEILLKPCKHRICKRCYEKSKKKRVTYCPCCNAPVISVVEINW